jgi:hypothetical protein
VLAPPRKRATTPPWTPQSRRRGAQAGPSLFPRAHIVRPRPKATPLWPSHVPRHIKPDVSSQGDEKPCALCRTMSRRRRARNRPRFDFFCAQVKPKDLLDLVDLFLSQPPEHHAVVDLWSAPPCRVAPRLAAAMQSFRPGPPFSLPRWIPRCTRAASCRVRSNHRPTSPPASSCQSPLLSSLSSSTYRLCQNPPWVFLHTPAHTPSQP